MMDARSELLDRLLRRFRRIGVGPDYRDDNEFSIRFTRLRKQ